MYYYLRACSDDIANDSAAIEKVRAVASFEAPKSRARIRKIAQTHRDHVLELFERKGHSELSELLMCFTSSAQQLTSLFLSVAEEGSDDERRASDRLLDWLRRHELTSEKVSRLREYLTKKSPYIRD